MQSIVRQIRERAACSEHQSRTGKPICDCDECLLGYVLPDINWADETPLTICQALNALDEYPFERLEYEAEKRQGKWPVPDRPMCPICDQRVDHLIEGMYEPCCENCAKLEREVKA